MWCCLAGLMVLSMGAPPAGDRARAEQLVKAGLINQAVFVLEQLVEADPDDVDTRLWIARLQLRLGRVKQAESAFRAALAEHPDNIDARIGLGTALTRRGDWIGALNVLREAEVLAGTNVDLYGALGRAYRRAGDDRSALDYFERARAITPRDFDIVSAYEATARAYGHTILFEGFGERADPNSQTGSGTLSASIRATPALHVDGSVRLQNRGGSSDTLLGGGVFWRAARATTVSAHALTGPGNTSLARVDISADVLHYRGPFEFGGSVHRLHYVDSDVLAVSPLFTWDPGGDWRFDARYTRSRSSFSGTPDTTGDNSVMLRETWRGWRRVWLNAVVAHGIESFENLTADRIGSLASTTAAGGCRVMLPSLTSVTATWEHEWRANGVVVDRVTIAVARSFP